MDDVVIGRVLYRELVGVQGPHAPGSNSGEESDQDPPEIHLEQPPVPVHRWNECAKCKDDYDAGTSRILGECTYHNGAITMTISLRSSKY